MIPFVSLVKLFLPVPRGLLSCLCLMSSLIGSLLPLFLLIKFTLLFPATCVLHKIRPLSRQLTPFAINSILVPKRSRWVCREALYSLVTPGHLLSPHLFLNYRHITEYLFYVWQTTPDQRAHLPQLWIDTVHISGGVLFVVYVQQPNSSFLYFRILLGSLSKTWRIRLLMILRLLSMLFEIHTGNFTLLKRLNADKTATDKQPLLMYLSHELFT